MSRFEEGVSSVSMSRRGFLGRLSAVAVAAPAAARAAAASRRLHLACNQYTWSVYFARDGRRFDPVAPEIVREMAACGLDGLEPTADSPDAAGRIGRALRAGGLEMRSLYVNSTLHIAEEAEKSIRNILAVAKAAKRWGTRIIVTNPNPIQWGSTEGKTDAQLETQARALERLGKGLNALGLRLGYHNHNMELQHAAREFHHMMIGTDPRYVGFCLDAHWIYRGSDNSQTALFDVVKLYGDRICELHIRQSRNGVWSEVFSAEGDIDYRRLVRELVRRGLRPHLTLEQAVEKGTPKTMSADEALTRSARAAREVFAPLASV